MRKIMRIALLGILVLGSAFTSLLSAQEQADRITGSPFPVSSIPSHLFVVKDANFSESELFTINTLQGILAKKKPMIYRDHGQGHSVWVKDIEDNYPVTVDKTFIGDFDGLITNFKDSISGYVLCNLHDNSSNVAISICGFLNAIAVTWDHVDLMNNLGLEMFEDVRSRDEYWAFNQYKEVFSKTIISYQKEEKDLFLSDYSVFANAFHFFDHIGNSMTNEAFSRMDNNAIMLGWGEDEYQTVDLASKTAVMVNAADWALNLSTLSNMDVETKQQNHVDDVTSKDNVHTVCFLMTDGDNVQWLLNDFAIHQNWFASPDRGKVNLGWTISPALCELAPTVMKYLYDQSSKAENYRDYFVAGPSGYGYFFPGKYPDMANMASTLSEYMKKSDLNIVNVIADNGNLDPIKPYLDQEAIDGVFLYTYSDNYAGLNGSIQWYNDKPVIGGRFALWDGANSPQSLANILNSMPRNPKLASGYSLIPVHVWSMNVSDVKACVDMLNENIRVVAPDEFVKLIKANLGEQPTSSESVKDESGSVKLGQNYPNPAKEKVTIRYFLPETANELSLSVFNLNGQLMKVHNAGKQLNGWHNLELSVSDLQAGFYFYKIRINGIPIALSPKLMMVRK
ncbi:GxGYxYP domain-containing protein [Sunxiuqinia sp. A32]|uniref:GxGYxYP domain-containing protein n=1 Tax=Sunxiuqinia sp. A32 TaxID=3461496 RepID=UPI0040452037